MPYYVYLIQSLEDNSYYKGYSENPLKRLQHHNNKESAYTSLKIPWKLVYVEECSDKSTALRRELALKKYSIAQIEILIRSKKNIVDRFNS